MRKFTVTGMSCAACVSRVEKAVSSVNGVKACNVSLLTNSMTVSGTATDEEIISAVKKAGYGAFAGERANIGKKRDGETAKLIKRLIFSAVPTVILMYISMGHNMFRLPLPSVLCGSPFILAVTEGVLALAVAFINSRFFINGVSGVLHGAPNMDTLVSLGSAASFIYSAVLTVTAVTVQENAAETVKGLYFESSAMILTLITVGKLLESVAKGKTTSAIEKLRTLTPETANVIENGNERAVFVKDIRVGDIVLVRPGESFPADGVVKDGECAVNESAISGESIPVEKEKGSKVYTATVNTNGVVYYEVKSTGEDTVLAKIINSVIEAASGKAPVSRLAERVAAVFVPVVVGIAALTVAVWLILGESVGFSLARGISVLVVSCPCALGLATPVAVMVASGIGAENGILFKTAAAIEETGRIDIVMLDKTGTLTTGQTEVAAVLPADGVSEAELLRFAAALEDKSEHPLSAAICRYAKETGVELPAVSDFKAHSGFGVSGNTDGVFVKVGKYDFVFDGDALDGSLKSLAKNITDNGKTAVFVSANGKALGIIAVADFIMPESKEAVRRISDLKAEPIILSGDDPRTVGAVAREVGVKRYFGGLLPEEKLRIIKESRNYGKVAMVGDGINDAPALTAADVGMAVAEGTDIAASAADVVLLGNGIKNVPTALSLCRATLKVIKENLFWAFIYNSLGIPVAAGVLSSFGITLEPMMCAAAMSLSSFCVVMNALRLKCVKISPKVATAVVTVKGMMCPHCERRVEKAVMTLPFVSSASASHKTGKCTVTLGGYCDTEALKSVIEAEDYTVKKVSVK